MTPERGNTSRPTGKRAPSPPALGVTVGCEGQWSSRKFGVRETAVLLATLRVACLMRAKNT
jgi:hypothetical protein